jgi:ABC-type Fe3+-hydroxamate transport system substrate-binding protein
MAKLFDVVPQRVVSLVPSMTESLFVLGMGDKVVGVTDYCTRPAELVAPLPKVGGTKNPNIEAILALQPDFVILNREENRKEDYEKLKAAGLTLWVTEPRTVQQALNLLWDVMDIFETPHMSPRVREIERAYDYTELSMRGEALDPIKVFAPIWKDPWMTFNQETYMHDVLSICGGHNVFSERERLFPLRADLGEATPLEFDDPRVQGRDLRYPRVSLAEVAAKQPDVILLPDEPYIFTEDDADVFYQMDIPAAKHGHIYVIEGALLSWHGVRLAYALQELPPLFDKVRREKEGASP